jgi:hypothetical protein
VSHTQIEITATDEMDSFIVFAWKRSGNPLIVGTPDQRHWFSKPSGNNYLVLVYGTELTEGQMQYFIDAFENGVFNHIDLTTL